MKVWHGFLFLLSMILSVVVWNMIEAETGFYLFLRKVDVHKVRKLRYKIPLRPFGIHPEILMHDTSLETDSKRQKVQNPSHVNLFKPHVSHDYASPGEVDVSHNQSHSMGLIEATKSHQWVTDTKGKPTNGSHKQYSGNGNGSSHIGVSVDPSGTTTRNVRIDINNTLALTMAMSPSYMSNVIEAEVGTGCNSTHTPCQRTVRYMSNVSGYDLNHGVVVKLALGDYTEPDLDVLPKISFKQTGTVDGLPLCSQKGREKLSDVALKVNESEMVEADVLHAVGEGLLPGGIHVPTGCKWEYSVALLIPFRDRGRQVFPFLFHMHKFLKKQNILYQIFFVEQADKEKFNRGTLMNIGFKVSQALGDFNCVILTDIDLMPVMEKHRYDCVNSPKHMAAYMDSLHKYYKRRIRGYLLTHFFGGVSAMTTAHYKLINGFSNRYFGWGGEDDDLYLRCTGKGLKVHRFLKPEYLTKEVKNPKEFTDVAHYHALYHTRRTSMEMSTERITLLGKARKRMNNDGLSDLSAYYHMDSIHVHKMYVWVRVTLHNPRKVA